MDKTPDRVSRRDIINGLAAMGTGVGVLGSSSRLSPVRTAEASSDEIEYAASFGDKHEFRHENEDDHWEDHDGSLAVQAGVVQTDIAKRESGNCTVWKHYVTVWAIAPFIRIFDEDDSDQYRSGAVMNKQTTDISTSADTDCIDDAPLQLEGSRFIDLYGEAAECPEAHHDRFSPAANYYMNDDTYEHKDYDGYSDVKFWSEEYEKESTSDRDDFNEWPAALSAFTGIAALAGAAATGPIGYLSLAAAPPSFFQLFSEYAQGNGATLGGNNQEINFSNPEDQCGLMGHLVEFKIVADAGEKFEVSVEPDFDIKDETPCYDTKLDRNIESYTCFNINVPYNSADTDVGDAQRINATRCDEH